MNLLLKEQQELYENALICYVCKEKFQNKYVKGKKKICLVFIMELTMNIILS